MRELPEGLAALPVGGARTTCRAWRLTRTDGFVLGFTEHDRDLEFAGTVFEAVSGFQASEVETGLGLSADAADVIGAFSAEAITRADLVVGRYDGALVETFLVNWQRVTDHVLLSTRELGEVRSGPQAFQAELRSLAARLDRPTGRIYSRSCDAELGDGRCRADIDTAAYRANGSVAEIGPGALVVSGIDAYEPGWFRLGRISFSTGQLAGLEFIVSEHEVTPGGIRLALWSWPETEPQAGDQFAILAGCDKARETCRTKFSNLLNFQGFPYLPGSDFAYGYADGETSHDGRPLVL